MFLHYKYILVLACLNIAYLIIGAALFRFLEQENARDEIQEFTEQRDAFIEKYAINISNFEAELGNFQEFLTLVPIYEYSIRRNGTMWDFTSSMFFSFTLVSTIGYGGIAPATAFGKVGSIFYSIIGIPLCMALLAGIGGRLHTHLQNSIQYMTCIAPDYKRLAHLTTLILFGLGMFVFAPAAIMSHIEDWSFLEGCYFIYISIATIGLGDYVPARSPHNLADNLLPLYFVFLVIVLFMGLAWLSTLLNARQNVFKGCMHCCPCQQTRCHPDMDSSSSGAKTESRDEQQELRYVTHTTGGSQTIPPVEIRRQTVAHQHGLQYKHDVY